MLLTSSSRCAASGLPCRSVRSTLSASGQKLGILVRGRNDFGYEIQVIRNAGVVFFCRSVRIGPSLGKSLNASIGWQPWQPTSPAKRRPLVYVSANFSCTASLWHLAQVDSTYSFSPLTHSPGTPWSDAGALNVIGRYFLWETRSSIGLSQ